ncbi:MAG TPA: serine hydrolase domain-containing protein [Candidatus Elarobacter sp.]|nr:serine hydrolase domain-containing protein [Candidatus Elarobacter sp.]
MAKLQKSYAVPGAQFAAAVGGKIVDTKSFGMADVAAKKPVTDTSVLMLASGSKPFTAMAVFTLIDKGKISLTTTAFPYLGLHAKDARFAKITLAELLNHSSGLNGNIRVVSSDPLDVAKAAVTSTLLFTPGLKQVYSNTGFNVLGAIVEKASGEKYVTYVQEHVFAPAGVSAVAVNLGSAIPDAVKQYDKSNKPVTNTIPLSGTPAGGWIMSATSIVKVLTALDAGKIISAKSRAAMFGPLPSKLKPRSNGAYYGGGWDVVYHDSSGRLVYGKNGGTTGAYCWMEHDANGADFAELYNGGTSGQDAQWTTAKPIETALPK